jgi:hypothetical protein
MGMGHLVGSLHLLHVLHHLLAHLLPHHLPHIGQPARGVEFPPLHFFVPANIDKLGHLHGSNARQGEGHGLMPMRGGGGAVRTASSCAFLACSSYTCARSPSICRPAHISASSSKRFG